MQARPARARQAMMNHELAWDCTLALPRVTAEKTTWKQMETTMQTTAPARYPHRTCRWSRNVMANRIGTMIDSAMMPEVTPSRSCRDVGRTRSNLTVDVSAHMPATLTTFGPAAGRRAVNTR